MATCYTHEALFQWLHRETLKRDYPHREVVFLADGLEPIWRLQERYFPQAVPSVDWYHVVEKLWAAGEALYPEGSDELREWVADQSERLRRSTVGAIRAELARQLLVPAQDRAWRQGQPGAPVRRPTRHASASVAIRRVTQA
jgi:hypothetical protein